MYIYIYIHKHPQIYGKVHHHPINRDLLFDLFGDDYIVCMYIYIRKHMRIYVTLCIPRIEEFFLYQPANFLGSGASILVFVTMFIKNSMFTNSWDSNVLTDVSRRGILRYPMWGFP